jgi:hypothetical protein
MQGREKVSQAFTAERNEQKPGGLPRPWFSSLLLSIVEIPV